jgi:hypothetical protein
MSTRRAGWIRSDVAIAVAALVSLTGVAGASCPGSSPEAVLECYSRAYEQMDSGVLEDLLGDDYQWVVVTPHRATLIGRGETVSMAVGMFENKDVVSAALTFEDGYSLVDGDESGTWRIEGVVSTLSVMTEGVEEAHEISADMTYYVRGSQEDGYEIYREVSFEGVSFASE